MNNIPICPICKKATRRIQGISSSTCVYYSPIYDEKGININPDRNKTDTEWTCLECNNHWTENNLTKRKFCFK